MKWEGSFETRGVSTDLIPNGLHIVGGMKIESEIFDILSAFSKNWIESNITLRDMSLVEILNLFRALESPWFQIF